ncbi:MAG: hypothetical protein ABEI78_02140, partial [Candidatus Nanohaloarchaea archaeon]
QNIGYLNETIHRHEELEFLIRILEKGKLAYVDEELVTIYDSRYPSPELMEKEKEKFLDILSGYVEKLEEDGHDIKCVHDYELAKAYFRKGNLYEGLHKIKKGCIKSYRDLASVFWSIIVGFKNEYQI